MSTQYSPGAYAGDKFRAKDEGPLRHAKDEATHLGEQVSEYASDIGTTLKEHPYTTIAVAAGLAFAIGALWKVGRPRQQSQLEALMARLPEMPSRESILSRWR